MIFPSKLFGPNGSLTGLFASSAMKQGLTTMLKPVVEFLYTFTSQTTTDQVTNERYLVNKGTGGGTAVVLTPEPLDTSFYVSGNDIATLNTQASTYDWTFSEPSGVLSVAYTGTETFLVTADDKGVVTLDNKLITFGG